MINTARPPIATPYQKESSSLQRITPTDVAVKFWGVRGSVPTPTANNQQYGGNTVCVEVIMGDQRIIFDSGTGIVNLGQHLQQQQEPINAHILFTHTQWDRIQGFPFFQPAFTPHNHFTLYGGTAPNGASIKHCLTDQMLQPHFAMPLQNMLANLTFQTLMSPATFQIGDISVESIKINPKTEALGYRISYRGYTLVYATDTPSKHADAELFSSFLKLADKADLLIYDGTYSDLTYLHHHAAADTVQPWEIGIDIAKKANVKNLVLVHHSPVQTDTALDQLQEKVQSRFASAQIAYEGMTL